MYLSHLQATRSGKSLKRACQAMEVGDSMLLDDKAGMKAAELIRKIWDNPERGPAHTAQGGNAEGRKRAPCVWRSEK